MQYIMSMAPGASTIFFNSIQDAFVDVFNWLSSEGSNRERKRELRRREGRLMREVYEGEKVLNVPQEEYHSHSQ